MYMSMGISFQPAGRGLLQTAAELHCPCFGYDEKSRSETAPTKTRELLEIVGGIRCFPKCYPPVHRRSLCGFDFFTAVRRWYCVSIADGTIPSFGSALLLPPVGKGNINTGKIVRIDQILEDVSGFGANSELYHQSP